ncbi:toxin co-regulated pilus biosynthesis Q family protein [Salmonella enterica]|uniref:toxin co-regulated pilus biosynthesis Q family protein n=1 Tax=Salmonella enterica TaxID=28901 RepID=UPI001C47EF89|nr:toxin co-regulated pilus biosynthesis Q family protein [Salmonella enterica]EDR6298902.1 hypothetical protein [Salmonella enterica subsp. enterica serovar Berkeley]EED7441876.1 hypothetical protein [Salmonella enterica subsp. salamae]EEP8432765.1 hypothetical protein [Salmonella enterica subsp. salamae]EKN4992774.1 toxin co-regulated pilus biosynthesis Q family protein [Salmonella enterica]ELI6866303.1 toxin co-regulated pilus biosynthesis Q family protein [Salmonella enterica]
MKISKSFYYNLLFFLPVVTAFRCGTVFASSISEILEKDSVSLETTKNTQLEDTLLNLSLPAATFSAASPPSGVTGTPRRQDSLPGKQSQKTGTKNIRFPAITETHNRTRHAVRLPVTPKSAVRTYRIDNPITESKGHAPASDSHGNVWRVERGGILFNILSQWCADAGWSLVWKTNASYRVLSTASFSGDFMAAVRQLFSSMGMQNLNVYIRFYTGNKVLLVTSEPFTSE